MSVESMLLGLERACGHLTLISEEMEWTLIVGGNTYADCTLSTVVQAAYDEAGRP